MINDCREYLKEATKDLDKLKYKSAEDKIKNAKLTLEKLMFDDDGNVNFENFKDVRKELKDFGTTKNASATNLATEIKKLKIKDFKTSKHKPKEILENFAGIASSNTEIEEAISEI